MLKKVRLKYFLWFSLFSIFTWWAAIAVEKYWKQPLVTDIIPSYGDNKLGIQFPLITFCQADYNFLRQKGCEVKG